jgi:RHS repeat-associated protein
VDTFVSSGGSNTKYYHADLIGTTRAMTVSSGQPGSGTAAVYTAFGEPVSGPNHRYGYAGAWQYQAHGDFPFLHVGHRYYDPGSGRFVQRDPIGILGGQNTYVYARNRPVNAVDPRGYLAHDTMTDKIMVDDLKRYDGMTHEQATRRWGEWNGKALLLACAIRIGIGIALDLIPPAPPPPAPEPPPWERDPIPYDLKPEPTIDPNLPGPEWNWGRDHVVPSIPPPSSSG